MCRRLSSLWSVSQVSNSQIYEALCYLCTLSTVGQTLTFDKAEIQYRICFIIKLLTLEIKQASLHHTTTYVTRSPRPSPKEGQMMTSCCNNNWCTLMTFQAQESRIQGLFYGLSHDGQIVFSTKLKPSGKSKLIRMAHLAG